MIGSAPAGAGGRFGGALGGALGGAGREMPGGAGALAIGKGGWWDTGAENGGTAPVPGSAEEVDGDGDGCSSWGPSGWDRLAGLDVGAGDVVSVDSIDSIPRGDATAFVGTGVAAETSTGAPCDVDDGGGRAGGIPGAGACGCVGWLDEAAGEGTVGAAGAGADAARGTAVGAGAGAGVVDFGVGGLVDGVGGGGIAPFGGPYCRMGRKTACCAGLLGSLMANMVASK